MTIGYSYISTNVAEIIQGRAKIDRFGEIPKIITKSFSLYSVYTPCVVFIFRTVQRHFVIIAIFFPINPNLYLGM